MDILAILRRARDALAEDMLGLEDPLIEDICAAIAELQADQQSAAEPPRERTDHAWDVIGGMEAF